MTTKLELFKTQIENALTIGDFDAIYGLFCTKGFSLTELMVFYRKNKQVLNNPAFWTSKLPHFHLKGMLENGLKASFLHAYLTAAQNCNHELNQHLFLLDKEAYIKHFKLWKAFEHPSFFDSFKQLSVNDPSLEKVLKELEIILKAQKKIALEEKNDQNYLNQYSFGEIMLGLSLYYYAFKQHRQTAGNKSWQTQVEVALAEEMNTILNCFKGKENIVLGFANNEELQRQFQQNEAPHHILGKKGLVMPIEPKFKLLYDIFNRMIHRKGQKGLIGLYLCGYADFGSVVLNPAPITTNGNYNIFKFNNAKSSAEERYFSNLKLASFSNTKLSAKTDITGSLRALDFYGIPKTIENGKIMVELNKVLQLLKLFCCLQRASRKDFLFINRVCSHESR